MIHSKIINESKQNHNADLNTKSKAIILRKNMTKAEATLWKRLRMNQIDGLHFRKQHPYGMYIIDFYCDKAMLAIEVDGEIHKTRQTHDSERTIYLESTGLKVIRFTNEDILNRIEWVISEIRKKIS
jgi:5-methyltetrahydrofolate--homocysteine methyltransferase/ATP-dependent helicase HrpA